MKAGPEDEAYMAAMITADQQQHFQNLLSDAETDAMPCSMADTERVNNQLEREISGITSNEVKGLKKEICIRLIEFQAG